MAKRVLMMSHGVTGATGFSKQLYLQSRALIESGYEVYVVHRDYRGEPILFPEDCGVKLASGKVMDNVTVLPLGADQWAEDIMPFYINKHRIDYIHTLGDIWCYRYISKLPRHHQWHWLCHTVLDTENMVGFWNETFQNADIAVVPSMNAHQLVEKHGHKNCMYVPHGVDLDVFKPCTSEEKDDFRKQIGIPRDSFVIGMVAHNQFRKMHNRLIDAFEIFLKSNPANARDVLVLHCLPRDQAGWDLIQILKDKGMLGNVLFTDKSQKGIADTHVTDHDMRKLYCSMDVHALSTGGEGFGIPIVEAMACGVPNIMTRYTTGAEFLQSQQGEEWVDHCGIAVPYTEYETHHTGGIWAKIDVKKMAASFQFMKDNPGEAKRMGMLGRKRAEERYDEKLIKNKWKELYAGFDEFVEKRRRAVTDAGIRAMRVQ